MYNGFTDSQPILHLTMKDSKMISTIVTDKQFVEYLAAVIREGKSKTLSGYLEQRQNCIKWVVSSIVDKIEPIIQQKIDKKSIIDKIDAAYFRSFIPYMDAFKKSGVVGKLKAANRLNKWLTPGNLNDKLNASYYNSMGDIDIMHENSVISDDNFFKYNLQKELPRILRAGATLLTGNNKLKSHAYYSESPFGGNVPVVYAQSEGENLLITVKGIENNSFCNVCEQLMKALTLMRVVSKVNIVKRVKNQLTLSVSINSECLGNKIGNGSTYEKVASVKNVEVSLESVLENEMNKLEKEKENLQTRKQKLSDEVTAISSRVIQIGRQLASLRTTYEYMKEEPLNEVKN